MYHAGERKGHCAVSVIKRVDKVSRDNIFCFLSFAAMSLEESRRSQRPYRYGMVLLCVGALINWLGLAENYVEPVRYVGVACIVAGALLICAAMCCWLHAPPTRTSTHTQHTNHPITAQVILDPSIRRKRIPCLRQGEINTT